MKKTTHLTVLIAAVAVSVAGFAMAGGSANAASMNAVEKLYADLAKLPADQRAKKILEGAKKEGRFEILSASYGKEWRPHERIWEKLYPGVKMAKSGLSSSTVAERFIAEEAAGRHLTDVAQLSSADMAKVHAKELGASYPTPAINKILPKYRGFLKLFPDNRWTPTSMTEHGMAYNFKVYKGNKAPKAWFDLCKSIYKGQASYEPSETRLLLAWYTMLGEAKAKELIQCIGKNEPILQKGHTTRHVLMQAGDHLITGDTLIYKVARDAYNRPKRNTLKIAFDAPVMADAFGSVISKNAKNPYAAALYVDFMLSEPSQAYMQKRMRGPLAVKHPFMPDDAQVVTFGPQPAAIAKRLHGYWNTYVTKKDAKAKR